MAKAIDSNVAKDKAMELAEDSRQTDWKFPSFTAELFLGKFRWDLVHPYPVQSEQDKKIGDDFIEKLRDVLETHVDPDEIDRTGVYPKAALRALARIGAFGMSISKEYGGLGFSKVNYCRALHFVGSHCQNTVTWLSAHQSIGAPQPLKLFGTEEQKKKYLPRLAKGAISAFALTEPDVGSDPGKMGTTAEPTADGKHYILNGVKLWTTNGPAADILVVMAKTPPKMVNGKERMQITTFIVEADSPGFKVEKLCDFMGLKGISNGLLTLKNVKVPAKNMIGKPGQGLRIALTTLNTGRLGLPASATGSCKFAIREMERWINERVQWGVPIGKHQTIAQYCANITVDTFAMESLIWITSDWADKGNADIRLEAAASKLFCTERSWSIMDDLLQVRGGRGYETAQSLHRRGDRAVPVERWLRDSRIGRIFEGSTQIMYLIMAREAMDTHFKLVMPLLQPERGKKASKLDILKKVLTFDKQAWDAIKFYAKWYPTTLPFIPARSSFNVRYLNQFNQDHLSWIDKTGRKLARVLFHTMAKYEEQLEFEQVILGNFVDIGVDLFAMATTLSFAESKLVENPSDHSPQDLANLFCKNARQRIESGFRAVKNNHNRQFGEVTDALMAGQYSWMYNDIMDDLPAGLRQPEAKVAKAGNGARAKAGNGTRAKAGNGTRAKVKRKLKPKPKTKVKARTRQSTRAKR